MEITVLQVPLTSYKLAWMGDYWQSWENWSDNCYRNVEGWKTMPLWEQCEILSCSIVLRKRRFETETNLPTSWAYKFSRDLCQCFTIVRGLHSLWELLCMTLSWEGNVSNYFHFTNQLHCTKSAWINNVLHIEAHVIMCYIFF